MEGNLIPTRSIALGFGASRKLIEVKDLAQASDLYRAKVEESWTPASRMPEGRIYDVSCGCSPRQVARVSYNGNVWGLDGSALFTRGARVAAIAACAR